MIDMVAFDADDTLWQNEKFYRLTQDSFEELLRGHVDTVNLSGRLLEAEKRNLSLYGFGIKGFVLSMVETAIEISDDTLPASVIGQILDIGREMMAHPVELLPRVRETVETISGQYRTALITKGDLFDQERKIAQSGLADLFDHVEIVADKSADTYHRVFTAHGSGPQAGLMAGNSLKSDILPMLDAGGWGVFVPHDLTWTIEHADEPRSHLSYRRIETLAELPALLDDINS